MGSFVLRLGVEVDSTSGVRINTTVRSCNSAFHGCSKVTKLLHETEAKIALTQLEKWK